MTYGIISVNFAWMIHVPSPELLVRVERLSVLGSLNNEGDLFSAAVHLDAPNESWSQKVTPTVFSSLPCIDEVLLCDDHLWFDPLDQYTMVGM